MKMIIQEHELLELKRKIINNKHILPEAKGKLGIILFKLENKFPLDEDESKILDDIILYLQVS